MKGPQHFISLIVFLLCIGALVADDMRLASTSVFGLSSSMSVWVFLILSGILSLIIGSLVHRTGWDTPLYRIMAIFLDPRLDPEQLSYTAAEEKKRKEDEDLFRREHPIRWKLGIFSFLIFFLPLCALILDGVLQLMGLRGLAFVHSTVFTSDLFAVVFLGSMFLAFFLLDGHRRL